MRDIMGIILTGWKKPALKELADIRSSSAIPVGGKYRAIDFALSNMVNSGIRNIGIITQFSFRSLMDHVGSGKEWDLDRRQDGLFIFPPSMGNDDSGWYKGSADAIYNNLTFLERSDEEYVVIAQGNGIYKMDFNNIVKYHREKNADITMVYREMNDFNTEELKLLGIIKTDDNMRIIDLQEKPLNPETNNGSLGIYVLRRKMLISLLQECAAHGNYDFVKDILIKKVDKSRIYGYKFDGYWRSINTVKNYYRCNMEMLDPALIHHLFMENGKIYTKVRDETPAKYNEEAEVSNSIIADGCIIEGRVENSVLFRGVHVKRSVTIRSSIIMQDSVIEEHVYMDNAILDKNVRVTQGRQLKGEVTWPIIVGKNITV